MYKISQEMEKGYRELHPTSNAILDFNEEVINLIDKHPRLRTYKNHLNFEESQVRLISTNKIESLNGRFKPFKDSRRK